MHMQQQLPESYWNQYATPEQQSFQPLPQIDEPFFYHAVA